MEASIFSKWYRYQQVYWYLHDHLDELADSQLEDYRQLQELNYDENFRETCRNCLKELDKTAHQEIKEDKKCIYEKIRDVFLKLRRK